MNITAGSKGFFFFFFCKHAKALERIEFTECYTGPHEWSRQRRRPKLQRPGVAKLHLRLYLQIVCNPTAPAFIHKSLSAAMPAHTCATVLGELLNALAPSSHSRHTTSSTRLSSPLRVCLASPRRASGHHSHRVSVIGVLCARLQRPSVDVQTTRENGHPTAS